MSRRLADTSDYIYRALVDAPDMIRKVTNFKRLSVTDFKVDIPRLASKKVLTAKLAEDGQY